MEERQNTCCFSGHRPSKLLFGYDEAHEDCCKLKKRLALEIDDMRKKGVTNFITGMAQGVDIWCAEIILALKSAHPYQPIRLTAIIPYEGQANRWHEATRERYFNILAAADETILLHRHYTKNCMHRRNRTMVDASAHLIAVLGDSPGGTKYTVDYARGKGLDIVVIDPQNPPA